MPISYAVSSDDTAAAYPEEEPAADDEKRRGPGHGDCSRRSEGPTGLYQTGLPSIRTQVRAAAPATRHRPFAGQLMTGS